MPHFATGIVARVLDERRGVARLAVVVDGRERRASAFTQACGPIAAGDRVIVNTTAVDLGLGTGGDDFVVWNLERGGAGTLSGGHVLKLRYTPWQLDTLVAESPESPHHDRLAGAESLGGMPVVTCGLHSQLPAVVATLKRRRPAARVAYLMTDGGALPLAYSHLAAELVAKGLIDVTVTAGHAFGGMLESVNVFSGLLAARLVAGADVTVVAIGPGIVGTGTALGHTGMEQGQALNAAAALGGAPVAALRISLADPRPRHRPVSHHTLSALRYGTQVRAAVAVPRLEPVPLAEVLAALRGAGLDERHDLHLVEAGETVPALAGFGLDPVTMGRRVADDPAYHLAAGAAGLLAAALLEGDR
jgi:hypothetical protein